MKNKFRKKLFELPDLKDSFFDSLKLDYLEFDVWYAKKSEEKELAYIYDDDDGIKAFLYLKNEYDDKAESISLDKGLIPAESRIKIGTLKLLDTIQGVRLGEGAIGMALWYWQSQPVNEIYVTVFPKHLKLIRMLERFGFKCRGKNNRGRMYISRISGALILAIRIQRSHILTDNLLIVDIYRLMMTFMIPYFPILN